MPHSARTPDSDSRAPRLSLRGLRPWGLLWAIAFVVLFDVSVARADWVWRWFPGYGGGAMYALEDEVLVKAADPVVVVFGSSRMRDALPPRSVERALGLEAGRVLNLSLDGGTPFDALVAYRRNRKLLSRAEVLVVGIDDWYVKANVQPNPQDRRFGTLRDRMECSRGRERAAAVVGSVWHTVDVRGALKERLVRIGRPPRPSPVGPDGRVTWRGVEDPEAVGPQVADSVRMAAKFHASMDPGSGRVRQLRELLRLAREDGVEVLLIELPLRAAYRREVRTHYPETLAYYREAFGPLHDPDAGVTLRFLDDASALGLTAAHFYDYGHLTPLGAETFVPVLARIIEDLAGDRIAHRRRR